MSVWAVCYNSGEMPATNRIPEGSVPRFKRLFMDPSDAELTAFLDEMLATERASQIEKLLREQPELRQRAALLARWRDQGGHSVGEIWRRRRLSCPSRSQLGSYLLSALEPEHENYIRFHLTTIECRACQANLEDLQQAQSATDEAQQQRRTRYFESSAGYLQRGAR